MDAQSKGREREIGVTLEKIGQAQVELKSQQKKANMNEADRMQNVERKIQNTEFKTKDVQKEIKMLKKLQHDKAQELVDLDYKDDYPEKIRSLLEEVRWAKDKQIDL